MSKEIMQQALDALINSRDTVWNVYQTDWRHGLPTRLSQMFAMEKECKDHDAAIAALEAELAKPEQPQTDLRKAAEMALDALEKKYGSWGKGHDILNLNAIVSLRQALIDSDATLINEATKPERNFCTRCGKRLGDGIHTCTPPEQEPVAWMQDSIELYVNDRPTSIYTIPLYTAPPKRDWQSLTEEQIRLMAHNDDEGDWSDLRLRSCWHEGYLEGARSAEAKLKEKNGD